MKKHNKIPSPLPIRYTTYNDLGKHGFLYLILSILAISIIGILIAYKLHL